MSISEHQNVAVITGAGRGLGAVIARHLAKSHKVLVTDIDPARVAQTVKIIEGEGGDVFGATLDVKSKPAIEETLDKACQRWGGVGILINNAALTRTTPLFEISPEEFSEITDVNLRGVFLGCQIFGAYFRAQKYGRIINMASLAAQNGGAATGAHYAASKGGIVTLTKVFARDLAADGVTVNAISPGPLDVDLVREILPSDKLDAMVKMIPVGHLGDPEFIAQMIALLVSPQASSVTGATFDANGGLYAR